MRKDFAADRRERIKHVAIEIIQTSVAVQHADEPCLRVVRDFLRIRENAQPAPRTQPAVADQFSRHRRHRALRDRKLPRQFANGRQFDGRRSRPIDFTDKIMSDLQCLAHNSSCHCNRHGQWSQMLKQPFFTASRNKSARFPKNISFNVLSRKLPALKLKKSVQKPTSPSCRT